MGVALDTLAQLSTPPPNSTKTKELKSTLAEAREKNKNNLVRRARAKFLSDSITMNLIDVKSAFSPKYWTSWHCARKIKHETNKLTTKYCNQRWCMVCNRIRTAKAINAYSSTILKFENPSFVTLTIPNCKKEDLKDCIEEMQNTFRKINQSKIGRRLKIRGIRKLECTYNTHRQDFHPHFHLIVDDFIIFEHGCLMASEFLVKGWLKRYPNANLKAQDIRTADEKSILELFKYFTKIQSKKDQVDWNALDHIFQSMQKKRVFQPFGGIKAISEEIEDQESQETEIMTEVMRYWEWYKNDWVDMETGEMLTGYRPSEEFSDYVRRNSKMDSQQVHQKEKLMKKAVGTPFFFKE